MCEASKSSRHTGELTRLDPNTWRNDCADTVVILGLSADNDSIRANDNVTAYIMYMIKVLAMVYIRNKTYLTIKLQLIQPILCF
jgi:hypothetical protein